MSTSTKKTTRVALRSTDRGGPVSLVAGILCLAAGFGMFIGINSTAFRISSATIAGLKDMALGAGGVLYHLVPVFALWLGWLLCVSARHYVSFRNFGIALALYASLLAFLTMITSISGFGSLMQYVLNMNEKLLNRPSPDSFGEFLARAAGKYENKLTPLVGGGAIGMLLAFPVWRLFGEVGGPVVLGITLIGLTIWMLRMKPIAWFRRIEKRLQGTTFAGASGAEEAVSVDPVQTAYVNRPDPVASQPTTGTKGAPYAAAATLAQDAPYVGNQRMPSNAAYTPYEEGPLEGFTSQSKDYFEPMELASEPAYRKPRASRQVAPQAYDVLHATVENAANAGDAVPASPHEPRHASEETPLTSAVVPHTTPSFTEEPLRPQAPTSTLPWEEEQPTRSAFKPKAAAGGSAHDVGVAPAFELTGKRVTVSPKAAEPSMKTRMDGTAAKPAAPRQISLPMDDYHRPPERLLSVPEANDVPDTTQEDIQRAEKLVATLNSFNITATVQQIVHGPAITRFAIRLAEGVNVNRLRNVMDNLTVELLAKGAIRAEIPIPGTPLIGIEVSNEKATTVHLSEVLLSPKMHDTKSPTAVALGKDIAGSPVICELMDMPHLLIAGATGSGKSVCINSIITSILYRAAPRDVRMILVDPKFVELQPYNDVPHLLLPVVVDPKKAVAALEWVCQEMDERYQRLQKLGVRNIDSYNKKIPMDEEPLPRIVIIIDEMSDLMVSAGKIIDEHVKRITAKARAAGICLILATQRPSVDVITGIIKANIPSRIAFQVSSQIDSRTILDSQGAEKLLGYGDMLYLPRTISAPKRVQGCFISDYEVSQVVDYVKSRHQVAYNPDVMEHVQNVDNQRGEKGAAPDSTSGDGGSDSFDELLPKAIEMAVEAGQMSISMLQRVLRVGYGRAGRLIDEMARRDIISGNEGTKARKTLITRADYQAMFGDDGFDH